MSPQLAIHLHFRFTCALLPACRLRPYSMHSRLTYLQVSQARLDAFMRNVSNALGRDDDDLGRIQRLFDLNTTETSRLFSVSRQAIQQWQATGVPARRYEKLSTVGAIADLLEPRLKTHRLPEIVRRSASLLLLAERHGTPRSRASLVEALQMRPFQRMKNSHGSTADTDSSSQERNRSLTGSLMRRRHSAVPRIRTVSKGDLQIRHGETRDSPSLRPDGEDHGCSLAATLAEERPGTRDSAPSALRLACQPARRGL